QIGAKLENKLREWAIENEEIYVVTGGVLKPGLKTIGENKVSVPNFYYKIIVDYLEPEFKALAFVMPNGSTKKHFLEYAVSIDSVERLTGIDFFPNIPDVIEDRIEESTNVSLWTKEKAESDGVPPLPFKKGRFNTLQAKYHIGQECKVCGTVVSTKYNKKGKGSPTYINLDKQFPNHVFSITIWGDDRKNFSFEPEMELMNKAICVTGIIKTFKGIPQLTLNSESQMEFLDEYSGGFKN
ncbi:MAG TPA: DNA/RNA non-specific endonuclease, partial [Bacteroidetes bacterium]|nr:DNA/RNA non-specific endonuclease [Bacteroidota bacterium]